jgi:hypothetical protein
MCGFEANWVRTLRHLQLVMKTEAGGREMWRNTLSKQWSEREMSRALYWETFCCGKNVSWSHGDSYLSGAGRNGKCWESGIYNQIAPKKRVRTWWLLSQTVWAILPVPTMKRMGMMKMIKIYSWACWVKMKNSAGWWTQYLQWYSSAWRDFGRSRWS